MLNLLKKIRKKKLHYVIHILFLIIFLIPAFHGNKEYKENLNIISKLLIKFTNSNYALLSIGIYLLLLSIWLLLNEVVRIEEDKNKNNYNDSFFITRMIILLIGSLIMIIVGIFIIK